MRILKTEATEVFLSDLSMRDLKCLVEKYSGHIQFIESEITRRQRDAHLEHLDSQDRRSNNENSM